MPAIVAHLSERAPLIKLRLVPFGTDLVDTGVTSGQTAMVIGRLQDPPGNLVVQHLMDEGFACVVRAEGSDLTKEALLEWLAPRVAKWWLPDDVQFVEAIPLGATGKILKTRLREQFRDYKLPSA